MGDWNSKKNRVVWIDIPVLDLERAAGFYRGVLDAGVELVDAGDLKFAVIDHEEGNGGCLVPAEGTIQSEGGVLIYLNVDGRIRDAVAKTTELGGQVKHDVHSIGPHGFRAIVIDTEGNRVALHSNSDA